MVACDRMNNMIDQALRPAPGSYIWEIALDGKMHFTTEAQLMECREFIDLHHTPQERDKLELSLQKCFTFIEGISANGMFLLRAVPDEKLTFSWETPKDKGTIFFVCGLGWAVNILP